MITKTGKHGFTLIELVMTIVIIGILAFSAMPLLGDTQSFALSCAAKKLESDIRYAQNLAITTGDVHGIRTTSDEKNTTYEVYNNVTNQIVLSPYHRNPMQEDFDTDYQGVFFVTDDHHIRFDNRGTPTFVTNGQNIVLKNSKNETRTVTINSIGLINIQ